MKNSRIISQQIRFSSLKRSSNSLRQKIGNWSGAIISKTRAGSRKTSAFIQRKPFLSFFIALTLLFILIVLGSTVFKPKVLEEKKGDGIKTVETFKLGAAPKISVQAQIEKTGVIKIVAQTPGIVSSINVSEGDLVVKGQTLIGLSSNYYGGNAASLGRQIAQNQYNLSRDTYDNQKETIDRQRKIAERSDANSDELQDIANKSLEETRSLLDLNESLLSTINSNLTQYEASNSGGVNDQLIFQTQTQKSQFQAAVNQLKQAIRGTELQAGSDKPPADLSNLQREIALNNLEVQEKSLKAGLEISKLQLSLAQVTEANMFPSSPYKGVVERVHVRLGESVSPGKVLATISGIEGKIILEAKVPQQISKNVSKLETSDILVNGKTIQAQPAYVSGEATNGQLYSIIYHIDDQYQEFFTDGGFVSVSIPIGSPDSNNIVPFIPLDSVFQTQEESTVYIFKDGKAQAQKIQLGQVQGSFVEVTEGIGGEDEVILSRNVVEGDKVKIQE